MPFQIIEKRARTVVLINVALCCLRAAPLRVVFGDKDLVTVCCFQPSIGYLILLILNWCFTWDLLRAVFLKDLRACNRWINKTAVIYIYAVLYSIIYCAITGFPLVKFWSQLLEKAWLPWLIYMSSDLIMVYVIMQFKVKRL